jgi:hypothetical protein
MGTMWKVPSLRNRWADLAAIRMFLKDERSSRVRGG